MFQHGDGRGEVTDVEFVVPYRHGAEVLHLRPKLLDAAALAVQGFVGPALLQSGSDSTSPLLSPSDDGGQSRREGCCCKWGGAMTTPVRPGRREQFRGLRRVAGWAGGEEDVLRMPAAVHDDMLLRAESAAAAAERLHHCRVEDERFGSGVANGSESAAPDAGGGPAAVTTPHGVPRPKAGRQVAPVLRF